MFIHDYGEYIAKSTAGSKIVAVPLSRWSVVEGAMADRLTPQRRSWLMSRVGPKDTAPEMVVRRMLFREGYRFRVHRRDLPGSPDIVLPRYRIAIFVHGCFWHRHPSCSKATTPKTRTEFWTDKFARNVERDKDNEDRLMEHGWRVIVVWECETKRPNVLRERLCAELEDIKRTMGGLMPRNNTPKSLLQ